MENNDVMRKDSLLFPIPVTVTISGDVYPWFNKATGAGELHGTHKLDINSCIH